MDKIIIDVCEPIEYKLSHVQGAINIPLRKVDISNPNLADIDKDTPIVLYCRSGHRASMALSKLSSLGFTNLTNGINKHNVEANHKIK
jgi:phage shock protein E